MYLAINLLCIILLWTGNGITFATRAASAPTSKETMATTTNGSTCTPFWRMPLSDQTTYYTYLNANTLISGDSSRSVCVSFRVSNLNVDNIIVDIGSSKTTWIGGCNKHFTLAISDGTHITLFGMCYMFDNSFIFVGPDTLYDGAFHQICITYSSMDAKLCAYRDSQEPVCITRNNGPYNTALGNVRIGWWPDNNRQFVASQDALIRSVSLFDSEISQECIRRELNITSAMNTTTNVTTWPNNIEPNSCSYHGIWQMAECACDAKFGGEDCSICDVGYFNYPNCYECSRCESTNGICDHANDTCTCRDPVRFTGTFCDQCQPGHYGPQCTNNTQLLSLQPTSVSDISARDGINITLTGVYFYVSSINNVFCHFRSSITWIVRASAANFSTVVCRLSNYTGRDSLDVSLSLDNATTWVSKPYNLQMYYISIQISCPTNGFCSRGECHYGGCECPVGYAGPFCDQCDLGYFWNVRYWYWDTIYECLSCSERCKNSATCVNQTCFCNEGYATSDCSQCATHYYGSPCLRNPILSHAIPDRAPDAGGINLTIIGDNFDLNWTSILCEFRYYDYWPWVIPVSRFSTWGTVISETSIICLSPRAYSILYGIFVSPDNGTTWIYRDANPWVQPYVYLETTCPVESSDCNRHGWCQMGMCTCSTSFNGATCSSCALGYFNYPNCYECSRCESNGGTCNHDNDTCVCGDPVRFTGTFCDQCQPGYYGPQCTNNTQLLSLQPTSVSDISARDGIDIILTGAYFYFSSINDVFCQFQSSITWIVQASAGNISTVICQLSNYTEWGNVDVSLSLDNATTWVLKAYDRYNYIITVRSTCPTNGSCYPFHGGCRFGNCACDRGYAGYFCEECAVGFYFYVWDWGWGWHIATGLRDCSSCDMCRNGICANSSCICQTGFTRQECDRCQENYFGPHCLPYPVIQSMEPPVITDIGGTNLTLFGVNFNSSEYIGQRSCKFFSDAQGMNTSITVANIVNDSLLICPTPHNLFITTVRWFLRLMINGVEQDYSTYNLQIIATCPNFTNCSLNGHCQFGSCICNSPYYGQSCELSPQPAVFSQLPIFVINEFNSTTIDLSFYMISGTPPFQYYFQNTNLDQTANFYYNHLYLNESSGILYITNALASFQNYNFVIAVTNLISTSNLSLTIQVPPSYNATVNWKNSSDYISGSINNMFEYSGNSILSNVPIKIWINGIVYGTLQTDSRGQFNGIYSLPSNSFGGELKITASHPASTSSPISQDTLYIGYVRIAISQWTFSLYAAYQTNLTDFVTIYNEGDFDLVNITVDLIFDTQCIQYYSIFPSLIMNLPASSYLTISLDILLNCSISNQYMILSLNESRIGSLSTSAFIISSQWSCRTRNDCNNHGYCIGNETCSCFDSYSGNSCEQCSTNLFVYPSCIQCPICVRGQAQCNHSVATCNCIDNTRMYGPLCQYCSNGYYGDNCESIPVVFSISPTSSPELVNETDVTLSGDSFQNISSSCQLVDSDNQTISISAGFISRQQMTCIFPSHQAGIVQVYLLQNGVRVYSLNMLTYRYSPSCPSSGCNHGECVMGTCRCLYPYFGTNCSSLPTPPRLKTMPRISLIEMFPFNLTMSQYLEQGDPPLEWSFDGNVPRGLSINSLTSLLQWTSAIASMTDYTIVVRVLQISTGAMSQQTLFLSVPMTYNVSVRFRQSRENLTEVTNRLIIDGQINVYDNRTLSIKTRQVNVWISIGNIRSYLPTINVGSSSKKFVALYTPLTYEYGTLYVGGAHPADPSNNFVQDYLTLLGLNIQNPFSGTLQMRAGENHMNTFTSVASISNPCNYSIDNLIVSLVSPSQAVTFYNISLSNCSLQMIPSLTTCSINFNIQFNQIGSGSLVFMWTNGVIQPAILSLPINIVADRAQFQVQPSSAYLTVARNSQHILVIDIYNVGQFRLGPLDIYLPNQEYVSVITPIIQQIEVSSNARFTLNIQIPDSAPLSRFNLWGYIQDRTYSISQSFSIELTIVGNSQTLFDLNIVCKDEFSYFGNNPVNLAGATITIVNYILNIRHVLQSNQTGQASVALVAGTYDITAQAPNHSSYRNVITVDGQTSSTSELVIFLQRAIVSYTFTVTKVSIEQVYTLTLEAEFVTYVPAPVLVISPTIVDLDELEANDDITQIDFTFTNYGLIGVMDLQFYIPDFHPFLKFNILQSNIGNVDANSSIIVSVNVQRVEQHRVRRGTVTEAVADYLAKYICGEFRYVGASLPVFTSTTFSSPRLPFTITILPSPDFLHIFPHYGLGTTNQTLVAPIQYSSPTCEDCVSGILQCIIGAIPLISFWTDLDDCLEPFVNTATNLFRSTPSGSSRSGSSAKGQMIGSDMSDYAKGIVYCLKLILGVELDWLFIPLSCFESISEGCQKEPIDSRRKRSLSDDNKDIALSQLLFINTAMKNFREMLILSYGDPGWLDLNCIDQSWEDAMLQAKQSSSSMGYFISEEEYENLMMVPHQCAGRNRSSERLLYYNRTMHWYSLNITEPSDVIDSTLSFMSLSKFESHRIQYLADLNHSQSLGYSNLFMAQIGIYQNYKKAHENSLLGTCAVVKIRIEQHVTITRQGFDAELKIDNNGGDTLVDVRVTIVIETETNANANHHFSIGQPKTSVNLINGNLGGESSGQINWLLIPYASAAPIQTTWYQVGGYLSYTINDQLVNITLQPDSIQVDPEASLDLAYFLQERVIGPDPFVNEFIAPQPFILAVVITNSGHGSVKNFRISSGQPTIVDNEKGLLVSFRIIQMRVNKEQQSSVELSTTLGNLAPFTTSTVTWTLLSSLKGYFRSFNASYIETNPNGDPKLSLFNSLTTHRLQHVVSLDILVAQLNDSQDDYLVNKLDGTETVFSSTNATLFFPVIPIQATAQYYSIDLATQRLIITIISNQTFNSSLIHMTLDNPFPQYVIILSKRIDDNLDITRNTWLTHNVDHLQSGDRVEDLLHLFDMVSLPSNRSYEIILSSLSSLSSTASNMLETTQTSMSTSNSMITTITNSTLPEISMQTNINQTSSLSNPTETTTSSFSPSSVMLSSTQIITSTFDQNPISSSQSVSSSSSIRTSTDHKSTYEISSSSASTTLASSLEYSTPASSHITFETTQSTEMSVVSVISSQYASIQSASPMTSMPTVTTNTYIRFTLSFTINDRNFTPLQLISELVIIFTSALNIYSNQINATVVIPSARISTNVTTHIRLFDSATESADSLLVRIRQQLANSSSALRHNELTSPLTNESISDAKRIFVCDGSTEQDIPCMATTTIQSTPTNLLTATLPLIIIPTVIGVLLFGTFIFVIVRYLRRSSKTSFSINRSHKQSSRF